MEGLLADFDPVGAVTRVWTWILAGRSCPDGVVRGKAPIRQVEAVARWRGPRGAFVEALVLVGFAIRKGGKLIIQGADEYALAWKQRRAAADREKQRRRDAKNAAREMLDAAKSGKLEPTVIEKLSSFFRTKKVDVNRNDGTDELGEPLENHPIGWWTWAMRERARDITSGNGLDSPKKMIRRGAPVDSAPPDEFLMWYAARKAEGTSDHALCDAWIRYLRDEAFGLKLWPLEIFMAEKVYRRRLTQTA